jgi:cytoplasmic iron level regulating protein YaaA (DUF328/UPF0246 family)
MAKRARGLMARFAITHQLVQPEQLQALMRGLYLG